MLRSFAHDEGRTTSNEKSKSKFHRNGTTCAPGAAGGSSGSLSISSRSVMPAMPQNSSKCVGEPGGVTMSQSRASAVPIRPFCDSGARGTLTTGRSGPGTMRSLSRSRSVFDASHSALMMACPLDGRMPLPVPRACGRQRTGDYTSDRTHRQETVCYAGADGAPP